jgi:alpha-tubulin suppressor-like RCC1 family protein
LCVIAAVVAMVAVQGARPAAAQTAPAPVEAAPAADPETALGAEATLVGVRQVATGEYHSCALLGNSQVRCWGYGSYGQLGQGSTDGSLTAVTVRNSAGTGPLVNVTQIVAGYEYSCALMASRQVRCWGYNGDGELGIGTLDESLVPVPVRGVAGVGRLRGVTQLSAGGESVCARLASGQLRCWGSNGYGQLGDDSVQERHFPIVVTNVAGTGPLQGVTQVDAGFDHTCARLSSGQARCWGRNELGQAGDGTAQQRHRPVVVKDIDAAGPLTGVAEIAVGYGSHTCARLTNGQARCWGSNLDRELGHGTAVNAVIPVVVTSATGAGRLNGVREIDAGFRSTCAVLVSGQVRCWGDNSWGQLGNGLLGGADRMRPKPVKGTAGAGVLVGVAQLDYTAYHVCVRLGSGQPRCWGYGEDGELGNGGTTNRGRPVRVQV